ncbi:bifunctional 4-hydroxy-2-oxoglutarate aldolase/2-dehydro-3-deoxy-phosphogluconate aldolase [Oligosphaera ethanolica]|uniref:2-dehydro-3-deoxy-phosphogluconate aldolase n=1 Tax=Oligosphaera ethanolica TaxID=760260 RepID=A0AAE4ANR2_9BACT|nr:bifunctional 4-hydroxy-2-oxoglutarate aldolase/2-dehydro-3-deoxy-phosphogluconate aldolase [Oligosphaera ethanolica]MDQ0289168.1 2-dehydro-3-deoxyphosphogluconate aldolase/(4S)-4-hydroxy-2-oxoglutarate aldolase [Oligosphaera ethanolica]
MFDRLRSYGVVPVVAVDSPDEGLRLCEALIAGGLPVAEITFRTAAAEATIREAAKRFPEMILGAGTILTAEQMRKAVDAGARFAVAPGCNPTTIAAARECAMPFAPGVCTPSDVERAVEMGCSLLKFFPAEAAGGVAMLKALLGPYGHLGISFCPTGGVTTGNLAEYLAIPQVAFVGGTWVAKKELIKAGRWDDIAAVAAAAVAAAKR